MVDAKKKLEGFKVMRYCVKVFCCCACSLCLFFSGCGGDKNISSSENKSSVDSSSSSINASEEDAFYSSLREDLEKNADSNYGADWFDSESESSYVYDDFPVFDPYDYEYTPPEYDDPFTDYDPLEGHSIAPMPEIPTPSVEEWNGYNPFENPSLEE